MACVVCVYCEYGSQDVQNARNLLASLWPQLIRSRGHVGSVANSLFTQHTRDRTAPSLEEITRLVYSAIKKFSSIYILVDAIDECSTDSGDRDKVVKMLENLLSSTEFPTVSIRIMITSRIKKSLLKEAVNVRIKAAEDGVRSMTVHSLGLPGTFESRKVARNVQEDETLKTSLATSIVRSARGIFLAARLYLNSLRTVTSVQDLEDAMKEPHKVLDVLYREAWERITRCPNGFDLLAQKAILWLSWACRYLTERELCHALAVKSSTTDITDRNLIDIEDVLTACQGLVAVDEKSGTVRFVHYTTRQFFHAHSSECFGEAPGVELTATCLTYLKFDAFAGGPCVMGEVDSSSHSIDLTLKNLTDRLQRYPFLKYCGHYWIFHARGEAEKTCQDGLLRFLRSPNLLSSALQAGGFIDLPALHLVTGFGLKHTLDLLLQETDPTQLNAQFIRPEQPRLQSLRMA